MEADFVKAVVGGSGFIENVSGKSVSWDEPERSRRRSEVYMYPAYRYISISSHAYPEIVTEHQRNGDLHPDFRKVK